MGLKKRVLGKFVNQWMTMSEAARALGVKETYVVMLLQMLGVEIMSYKPRMGTIGYRVRAEDVQKVKEKASNLLRDGTRQGKIRR